jgi:hypothetical protein
MNAVRASHPILPMTWNADPQVIQTDLSDVDMLLRASWFGKSPAFLGASGDDTARRLMKPRRKLRRISLG